MAPIQPCGWRQWTRMHGRAQQKAGAANATATPYQTDRKGSVTTRTDTTNTASLSPSYGAAAPSSERSFSQDRRLRTLQVRPQSSRDPCNFHQNNPNPPYQESYSH
ncbi:hypothetical protein FBUS_09112 [Fasciolopsis buskii]|uniref:Uncharacterized protein n=1 Tax=Fasciolopsis buskii TaxID=27845 RepID=A0A8E0VKN0_9TREM|nr:hypothetical protein FBUS_09112 [Fasciolopsis buski]